MKTFPFASTTNALANRIVPRWPGAEFNMDKILAAA
jgi:hypothetical protein